MIALGILPVVSSFGVLAAHFLRGGHIVLVAITLFLPVLLFFARPAIARLLQVTLMAASVEWMHTMIVIAQERIAAGLPHTRAVLIMAAVALFTLASAFAFHLPAMRRRYGLHKTKSATA